MNINESYIIGVDFSDVESVLTVGRYDACTRSKITLVNTFVGEEAVEMYKKINGLDCFDIERRKINE